MNCGKCGAELVVETIAESQGKREVSARCSNGACGERYKIAWQAEGKPEIRPKDPTQSLFAL